MKPYRCPVCGYANLEEADPNGPIGIFLGTYEICGCCGTEFGFHIDGDTPEEIEAQIRKRREEWVKAGRPWFDPNYPPPSDWDWKAELRAIGVDPESVVSEGNDGQRDTRYKTL